MARSITRQTLKLFGTSAAASFFGQFGSQAANAPVNTKTIATIQALAAWLNGWQQAVALGQAPYLEDMNSFCYVMAYMIAYLNQDGIAEWDAGTTYFTGSVVKSLANAGYTEFYISLIDSNTNNALPTRIDNTDWQFLLAMSSTGIILPAITLNSAKIAGLANGTLATDAAAFGQLKLFQTVTATTTTTTTTTSTAFVDTALTVAITPSSTAHKVLLMAQGVLTGDQSLASRAVATLTRGSTNLLDATAGGADLDANTSFPTESPCTLIFLDSPASLSAQTYKVQIKTTSASNSAFWNRNGNTSSIVAMEVV